MILAVLIFGIVPGFILWSLNKIRQNSARAGMSEQKKLQIEARDEMISRQNRHLGSIFIAFFIFIYLIFGHH
jgi:hypothetical protein